MTWHDVCVIVFLSLSNIKNHETLKATQYNAIHPRQSFSKKNELPQAGLKPTTFYQLIEVHVAQLAWVESHIKLNNYKRALGVHVLESCTHQG